MSQHHAHPDSNEPRVHRITEARVSHTTERDGRVRKYTITMTVRVICFILAFFASGWLRWAFLIGAVFLPYVAVVIANGGADLTKRQPPPEFYKPADPKMLGAQNDAQQDFSTGAEVIDGSLNDDHQHGPDDSTQSKEC